MANLANPTRNNGTNMPAPAGRTTLSEWLGVEPFDLFRNFYSPVALDATVGQGRTRY